MSSLLEPGSSRAVGVADDESLVQAMLQVEVAWMRALADNRAATAEQADAVAAAASARQFVLDPRDIENAGNPVLPLVRALREQLDGHPAAALVHRGLTSQDVLDSALMLIARDALERLGSDQAALANAVAALADDHRGSLMAGRTLTQYAVPITFGLKAANWLAAVLDVTDELARVRQALPVQCGGAAGTLAKLCEISAEPSEVAAAFADHLRLTWPGLPWHTSRSPITRLGDSLVRTCDALGVIAVDVLTLGRPEIAEVREGPVAGRGESSTMSHKQNPILAVLVKSASMQAPQLGAQLHLAAASAVDERPDGAWHAEWPSLARLLELTVVASSQASELVRLLEVDTVKMERRANEAASLVLAERGGDGELADSVGASEQFIDVVLARHRKGGADDA